MNIQNRKAIITGANRNIGAAIALKFASEGADICIHYRSDIEGAKDIKERIEATGSKVFMLHADFSQINQVDVFFKKALELLGGVDIIVNNAAAYDTQSFLELPVTKLEHLFDIGVLAPMQLIQNAARYMISSNRHGSIINISSISGLRPYLNRTAHATAKSALNMLTKNVALELGKYGIRVNAICPGEIPYDNVEKKADEIPLKRYGKPSDIANAALFLASEESSWITGHVMIVDGGQSLGSHV